MADLRCFLFAAAITNIIRLLSLPSTWSCSRDLVPFWSSKPAPGKPFIMLTEECMAVPRGAHMWWEDIHRGCLSLHPLTHLSLSLSLIVTSQTAGPGLISHAVNKGMIYPCFPNAPNDFFPAEVNFVPSWNNGQEWSSSVMQPPDGGVSPSSCPEAPWLPGFSACFLLPVPGLPADCPDVPLVHLWELVRTTLPSLNRNLRPL